MKTYVIYNPYYNKLYLVDLKLKEVKRWGDFNSEFVLIGEL